MKLIQAYCHFFILRLAHVFKYVRNNHNSQKNRKVDVMNNIFISKKLPIGRKKVKKFSIVNAT